MNITLVYPKTGDVKEERATLPLSSNRTFLPRVGEKVTTPHGTRQVTDVVHDLVSQQVFIFADFPSA